MFAVVESGGKQYRVARDDVVRIEKLEVEAGSQITLDRILMVGDSKDVRIGTPVVSGAVVKAAVIAQIKAPKILVFHKRRRKNSRRLKGHRQELTLLRISDILVDGKSVAGPVVVKKAKPAPSKAETTAKGAKPAGTTATKGAAAPKEAASKAVDSATSSKTETAIKVATTAKTATPSATVSKTAKAPSTDVTTSKTSSAATSDAKTNPDGGKDS